MEEGDRELIRDVVEERGRWGLAAMMDALRLQSSSQVLARGPRRARPAESPGLVAVPGGLREPHSRKSTSTLTQLPVPLSRMALVTLRDDSIDYSSQCKSASL